MCSSAKGRLLSYQARGVVLITVFASPTRSGNEDRKGPSPQPQGKRGENYPSVSPIESGLNPYE